MPLIVVFKSHNKHYFQMFSSAEDFRDKGLGELQEMKVSIDFWLENVNFQDLKKEVLERAKNEGFNVEGLRL